MNRKQATRNASEQPEPEELTALDTDTDTDTDVDSDTETETETETATPTDATTFPLTRTFIHCDSTGRELAHVELAATVTLTRLSGVVLTVNEIERRFRRNFYLSFKGGKADTSYAAVTTPEPRSRRTLSPEHKHKLQEARQRRRDTSDKPQHDEESQREIVKLATTLLNGFSKLEQSEGSAWFGKAAVLAASGIVGNAIEPASWTLAIRYLLDTGQVEARGEKRGREYRRVRNVVTSTKKGGTK